MSKTTNRLGKPLYKMTFSVEANPTTPEKVLGQWAVFDVAAKQTFGKPYDALNSQERSELHFQLNLLKETEAAQRKAAQKGKKR